MAKNTYKKKEKEKRPRKNPFQGVARFFTDRRVHLSIGLLLLISAIFLGVAFISFLFTGAADQSVIESIRTTGVRPAGSEIENWLGITGAWLSHLFMFRWLGISAFFLLPILFGVGYQIVFRRELVPLYRLINLCLFAAVWLSITIGSILLATGHAEEWGQLSGGIGYEWGLVFRQFLGLGSFVLLAFALAVFVIFYFDITHINAPHWKWALRSDVSDQTAYNAQADLEEEEEEEEAPAAREPRRAAPPPPPEPMPEPEPEPEPAYAQFEREANVTPPPRPAASNRNGHEIPLDIDMGPADDEPEEEEEDGPSFTIEKPVEEPLAAAGEEAYDPTLDLASFQLPPVELLQEHSSGEHQVSSDELEANKNRIVETLSNYGIGIASIKAAIGPTVTLYEIVPEAGVRISKIKNLEDDIALNLAALGIRIIAPIPGKGTIGIEVPNKNREIVSARGVISTEKFLKSKAELPIVLGKNISNEVFVTDLAKMPHLLMAGATGQGKSVGLNVLLTSLIYRKHPSQLKFVLVDPKKVELSLFSKIERHYLAMLPDGDEAIITDTKKVINTLNSLCIEMDTRYDLLKDAGCRNLKEYNQKFTQRKLNPEKGHRYMPYIVLVIDELADLMMTAGKEVETPIARLAQLARAIGIHLVVATQRPSVNVITGIIKANFPARLSFKVTSKVDSRTILDTGGAEQLVGMGDMLLSINSELTRLQCAFVDTPEVEAVCDFVGQQRGYESAYLLPEYYGDDSGDSSKGDVDLADRDPMFADAARVIVAHQQGSTSLLQRRLKLGYNRAGRLIDQLEAAGIVGPFEGSKAREVLIRDEVSLEQLLSNLDS
ncbi:DNA segregation ATPase FtsK/SpoIIIE, S-DNA-T family [Catalinimonas alkaloidigena]|uniref:DNA segregation ATPase FtsK/SpoIIIE, S-DNA-T family n=1 Tax=Catalinimonas alkaloidigena TaxID=1075417 RepID=A0A1G9DCZ9_9BACT|nr:DNA translocase FtsK [Catalinimonas alkaloidigena]SDK61735.1 DNA segregation ATPase FtsK/SpoIIIE, S-DNA-T family [Catalinimonas alkaloidigena]